MRCVICKHGEITPGTTTVTLERGTTTRVVKAGPATVHQFAAAWSTAVRGSAERILSTQEGVRMNADMLHSSAVCGAGRVHHHRRARRRPRHPSSNMSGT